MKMYKQTSFYYLLDQRALYFYLDKKAKWLAGHWTLKNLILSPTWSLQNVLPNSLKWIVFEIKKIQDLRVRMWAD